MIVGRLVPAGTGMAYHEERRRKELMAAELQVVEQQGPTNEEVEEALRLALNISETEESATGTSHQ